MQRSPYGCPSKGEIFSCFHLVLVDLVISCFCQWSQRLGLELKGIPKDNDYIKITEYRESSQVAILHNIALSVIYEFLLCINICMYYLHRFEVGVPLFPSSKAHRAEAAFPHLCFDMPLLLARDGMAGFFYLKYL